MFYHIKGTAEVVSPNLVVIDAGGVGYAINTSYRSAQSVKSGDRAAFYTFLYVREDIFDIYGFIARQELECFKLLLGISGVGPKAALAILGVVAPDKLALCVVSGDEKALCAAPGVGKKLAQRIILELKDKLAKGQLEGSGMSVPDGISIDPSPAGGAQSDALEALAVLGYPRSVAIAALLGEKLEGLTVDEIVRTALKKLF